MRIEFDDKKVTVREAQIIRAMVDLATEALWEKFIDKTIADDRERLAASWSASQGRVLQVIGKYLGDLNLRLEPDRPE